MIGSALRDNTSFLNDTVIASTIFSIESSRTDISLRTDHVPKQTVRFYYHDPSAARLSSSQASKILDSTPHGLARQRVDDTIIAK